MHKLLSSKSILRFGKIAMRPHEPAYLTTDPVTLSELGWKQQFSIDTALIRYAKQAQLNYKI